MKQDVRLVVFDFDGTLLDSTDIILNMLAEFKRFLQTFGKDIPDRNFFERHWGMTFTSLMRYCGDEHIAGALRHLGRIAEEHFRTHPQYCGTRMKETIRAAREQGMRTAIMTNRTHDSLASYILCDDFFAECFDCVVGVGRAPTTSAKIKNYRGAKYSKPDPRAFDPVLSFAKKLRIEKEHMLFVGDTLIDREAAKSAGIPFIGTLSGPIRSTATWKEWGGLSQENLIVTVDDILYFLPPKHRE